MRNLYRLPRISIRTLGGWVTCELYSKRALIPIIFIQISEQIGFFFDLVENESLPDSNECTDPDRKSAKRDMLGWGAQPRAWFEQEGQNTFRHPCTAGANGVL